jgi:hypothetical protein
MDATGKLCVGEAETTSKGPGPFARVISVAASVGIAQL